MQLVLIVGWYNPFFWFAKTEMNLIHEFIADKKSVEDGDAASLAEMLLAAAYPQQQYLLANSFFYSPIKRRLLMITQNKNPRFSYLRRVIVLPLLAMVVLLFAFRKSEHNNITSIKLDKTYTVVIDAGHGGKDFGAVAIDGKTFEKDIALQLAKQIKELNTNENLNIILTRDEDVLNRLNEKVAIAEKFHPDIFISLHCNGVASVNSETNATSKNIEKGAEIYISNKKSNELDIQNRLLGTNIIAQLTPSIFSGGAINKRKVGIWVLDQSNCPSVIVEAGFLTNKEDVAIVTNADKQKEIAKSILRGVENYLQNKNQIAIVQADTTKPNKDSLKVKLSNISVTDKNGNISQIKDTTINVHYLEGYKTIYDSTHYVKILFVVNGVKQNHNVLNEINPNDIESVNVLKDKAAIAKYGNEGRNGVIEIFTKNKNLKLTGVRLAKFSVIGDTPYLNGMKGKTILKGVKVDYAAVSDTSIIGNKEKIKVTDVTIENANDEVFTVTQVPAEFPGGLAAWQKYLERNLNVDVPVKSGAPPGKYTVFISFIVHSDGTISNITANDPGFGTKEEAMRVIEKGPNWKPAIQNGKNVNYLHKQGITFVISKEK